MDTPEVQTWSAERLVQELNTLLVSLSVPLTVTTPYDLTPSLLLAILESILRTRLPISEATRESQTLPSKVEAMKIFLGVLEDDVLCMDIGLSEIDPRRLAAGEWDDLVFVGNILCWVARQQAIRASEEPTWDPSTSSSGDSNGNTTSYTGNSQVDVLESSATTVSWSAHPGPSGDSPASTLILDSVPHTPRFIREVETPSLSIEMQPDNSDTHKEFCNCPEIKNFTPPLETGTRKEVAWCDCPVSASIRPSVRYQGWIELVEDDVPIFEKLRERPPRQDTVQMPRGSDTKPRHWRNAANTPSNHISSPHYTLSLLQERARLSDKLARLRAKTRESQPRPLSP